MIIMISLWYAELSLTSIMDVWHFHMFSSLSRRRYDTWPQTTQRKAALHNTALSEGLELLTSVLLDRSRNRNNIMY